LGFLGLVLACLTFSLSSLFDGGGGGGGGKAIEMWCWCWWKLN